MVLRKEVEFVCQCSMFAIITISCNVNTLTYCLLSCTLRCNVPTTELRRAAIHLLLSMLCLPLHFQDLAIKGYTANTFVWKFLRLSLS